jgi:hypothetical protein
MIDQVNHCLTSHAGFYRVAGSLNILPAILFFNRMSRAQIEDSQFARAIDLRGVGQLTPEPTSGIFRANPIQAKISAL